MVVLVTCKNEEDPFKNEGTRVFTKDLPLEVYVDFSRNSRAVKLHSPRLVLLKIQNSSKLLWWSWLPERLKKIQSKMKPLEWSQHYPSIFKVLQVTGSGQNSNSFKLLWLSLLPARMRKIQSKMKALERSKQISHYKSMRIFQTLKGS